MEEKKYYKSNLGIFSTYSEHFEDIDANYISYPNFEKAVTEILAREKAIQMDAVVSDDFGEPEIEQADFDKWFADQKFYSESEGTPIDKYILENYFDSVEQFIKSPKSKAAKGVFEVATQVIKKYLSQNSR